MQLENDPVKRIDCTVVDCAEIGREWWYLKTEAGLIERYFCYAHSLDFRPADKAAFGDAYIPGSDEGEA